MIALLDLGDMGYDVFQNSQLNFWGIRGYANSNLKRGMLSKSWLGHKVFKLTLEQLMIDLLYLGDIGYAIF